MNSDRRHCRCHHCIKVGPPVLTSQPRSSVLGVIALYRVVYRLCISFLTTSFIDRKTPPITGDFADGERRVRRLHDRKTPMSIRVQRVGAPCGWRDGPRGCQCRLPHLKSAPNRRFASALSLSLPDAAWHAGPHRRTAVDISPSHQPPASLVPSSIRFQPTTSSSCVTTGPATKDCYDTLHRFRLAPAHLNHVRLLPHVHRSTRPIRPKLRHSDTATTVRRVTISAVSSLLRSPLSGTLHPTSSPVISGSHDVGAVGRVHSSSASEV